MLDCRPERARPQDGGVVSKPDEARLLNEDHIVEQGVPDEYHDGDPDKPKEKDNDRRNHQVRLDTPRDSRPVAFPRPGLVSAKDCRVLHGITRQRCHTVSIASRSPASAPTARPRLAYRNAQATVAAQPSQVPTNIRSPLFP